ncbi:Embryonic stem cell-specific 5-hydroxymethylcytosine-binding protein [Thelohanellus kitauei]|uniref:Abasic site processing protein HMCES n=1 Tax=Thelohanellus kitauei TaxID=669202 RepID=A0A0C2IY46_THEKT|nr:Embryonic stem cell-specific 5-hydroxymethylcytosine-binding protein [Thelohanellus kitauei]
MCGRLACYADASSIENRTKFKYRGQCYDIAWKGEKEKNSYQPSYNISKTGYLPSIINENQDLSIRNVEFGMKNPTGSPASDFSCINGRVETVAEKPFFAKSLKDNKRCVIICQGFYEWTLEEGRKIPHYCTVDDFMFLAGLYTVVNNKITCCIITTPASSKFSKIHNRMPAILENDYQVVTWLIGSGFSIKELPNILGPVNNISDVIVTTRMNNSKYNGEDCIVPVKREGNFYQTKLPFSKIV